MKILASQIWIIFLSATTAFAHTPGHGSPQGFDHCEYNAEAVRTHRPSNIVKAEKALKIAEKNLERLEKGFTKADECENKCKNTVYKVIEKTVGKNNLQYYLNYLGGSFDCYQAANSAVRRYNMYAQIYGWDVIKEELPQINPQRMIATDPKKKEASGGGTITMSERPDNPQVEVAEEVKQTPPVPNNESNGEIGTPVPITLPQSRPKLPAPLHQTCNHMEEKNTLSLEICNEAAKKEVLDGRELNLCKRCLGPINNYGRCLRRKARLEQELSEAQELAIQREFELDAAKEKPSSKTTCTDCMKDTRNWWERWGPTLATGALVALPGYLAYRQEKSSYKHYKNVIHENNNRLGYPTEPREDLSGYRLAAHLVNGAPLIVNTGLSTGAFGCAGSSMYGAGSIIGGLFGGTQRGGANGYNNQVLNSVSGNVGGILNGGMHQAGVSQPSGAQIDAWIRAQQQSIAQQQTQLAALRQSQTYYQSRAAIEADALRRVKALGAPPSTSTAGVWIQGQGGVSTGGNYFDPLRGGFWNSGQLNGGLQFRGQVQTYGNAGIGGVQPLPVDHRTGGYNNVRTPGYNSNPSPPRQHRSTDRVPL